jgi:DNA-binding response OmpR family regulator
MNQVIAVVDDEPDIVELITLHLKKAGFDSHGFFEAKSFIDSLEKRVSDLVILDLMLPDIDGLEVCKLLRRKEEWAFIPVIMVTARGDEADKILGLELGADDYITKPFSPKEKRTGCVKKDRGRRPSCSGPGKIRGPCSRPAGGPDLHGV